MGNNDKLPSENPVTAVLNSILGPLVEQTSKLPPVLAYGSAIVIAILAISILGVLIPNNLIWLLGVIVLVCLIAFIFTDWDKRRTAHRDRLAKREAGSLSVFYVVVHEEGDPTEYVSGAEVSVGLPNPVIQKTQDNGMAIFNVPTVYLKRAYHINAKKDSYEKRAPILQKITADDYIKISLKRDGKALPSENLASPKPQNRLRLIQIKPEKGINSESNSGRLAIGRDPQNELALPENAKGVSWTHGIIVLIENQYIYRHLSNSQSTTIVRKDGSSILLVGGEKSEAALLINDHLIIGNFEFVVTYDLITTDRLIYYTPT